MTDVKQAFESALLQAYPDVAATGTVTRAQIVDTMQRMGTESWPNWILQNRVSRGVYSLSAAAARKQVQPSAVPNMGKSVVQLEQVDVENFDPSNFVPAKDGNYVPVSNTRDIESVVRENIWFPVFVTGHTGNGKSTMIEQAHAKLKKPLIRININNATDEEQLIGSKTLVDGNIRIVDGPIVLGMKYGIPVLLDEIDAGNANSMLCIQSILEGNTKPYYYKLRNELIYPQPGFNIYATANTKGKGSDDGRYMGTNFLNEAFLDRFSVTIVQDYPSAATEKKIVLNLMEQHGCVDEVFADDIVKWADSIRRTFESGGVDELITTRRLSHVVSCFKIFKDRKKAVELCCNRFDDVTKAAFVDLFDKISSEVQSPAPAEAQEVDTGLDEIPF